MLLLVFIKYPLLYVKPVSPIELTVLILFHNTTFPTEELIEFIAELFREYESGNGPVIAISPSGPIGPVEPVEP